MGSAKNCRAAQLPANHGAATAPDAPPSPRMRHDEAQRMEPGSSNKRISRGCARPMLIRYATVPY